MSGYGEPEWVSGGQQAGTTQEVNEVGQGVTAADATAMESSKGESGKGGCILSLLSLLNVALSAMMGTLGILTLIEVHRTGVRDLSEPFLASYMVLFAILLLIYEIMWWAPVPNVNRGLRKNFGFMYGLRGKGLYLIFVAFLCFGLGKDASVKELNYATGAAYLAGGCLHMFIIFFKPEVALTYAAPTVGLGTYESETAAGGDPNVV
mmetsp:Transcript_50666/g.122240  ORF Transcript_50666/g.122240 Transcript_50666/m.122240 type:complete len:207 (+) Transcript_50666:110-730(+)|eukprot:CAMPEP_0113483154 /NCGR_PEP_ID=MMETSP0014_2-20120614/23288_1 /TAXON_ID=2857 /ORGANISM="Nitzschia sp." /LENGTH=206 /DNA_ID=CAMNT_0000376693 /DNA_START=84 /DNA_END=704 /DNA_ORIENTATION=+ /assembly_acc=CAM_ASM_000159